MKLTVPEALEKLASHGSARQIADYLQREGIRGDVRCSRSCLVSEYLSSVADGEEVSVLPSTCLPPVDPMHSTGSVNWSAEHDRYDAVRKCAPLPEEVDRLAVMFDRGELPELVKEPCYDPQASPF